MTPPRRLEHRAAGRRATAAATCVGRHVVEQEPRRAGGQRLVDLAAVAHLDLERQVGPRRRGPPTAAPTPPASAAWFSLMRITSYRPARWLTPPPSATAALLERAQPRRGLARVEDPRGPAGRRAPPAPPRGQRGDARQPPEEVQRRALGGEQRPRRARDAQHRRRRLAPLPLGAEPLDRGASGRAQEDAPRRRRARRSRRAPSAMIVATPRAAAGTVRSVVTSPAPTSSASARSIRSSVERSGHRDHSSSACRRHRSRRGPLRRAEHADRLERRVARTVQARARRLELAQVGDELAVIRSPGSSAGMPGG